MAPSKIIPQEVVDRISKLPKAQQKTAIIQYNMQLAGFLAQTPYKSGSKSNLSDSGGSPSNSPKHQIPSP